ncbi:MAG: ABC transporter permease, partial [Leptospiraceae bacterium]|nr:ABC transporter permease [Leptospiraceae bacterium]
MSVNRMWFLSLRQLLSRPQQTILTFIGIMLGTATYVIFSGMMLGFQEYLIEKMINDNPHITISPRDEVLSPETFDNVFFNNSEVKWLTPPSGKRDNQYLTNVQGWFEKLDNDIRVVAYAPRLSKQVIFTNGRLSVPGTLVGIDVDKEKYVTSLHKSVIEGDFKVLKESDSVIVIGEGLMQRLGGRMTGTVNSVAANGDTNPLRIRGIIRMGVRQFDDTIAYASIQTVQNVSASPGQVSSV